jgi:hypothetical protein
MGDDLVRKTTLLSIYFFKSSPSILCEVEEKSDQQKNLIESSGVGCSLSLS